MKVGQEVYYYDVCPKKCTILKIDDAGKIKIYTVLFDTEEKRICGDIFFYETEEKLIDKMEDELYYLQYNIDKVKKGEL